MYREQGLIQRIVTLSHELKAYAKFTGILM